MKTHTTKEAKPSGHTPGPWEVRRLNGITYVGPTDNKFFNTASVKGFGAHDIEANARLIAAAPELLEAAKLAEYTLGTLAAILKDNRNVQTTKAVNALRVAIQKAEAGR